MKAILGRKMGMTEVFTEDGTMYPVTVVEVLPNVVTAVMTEEKNGYVAVQVGLDEKKESRANKPEKGNAAKAGTPVYYHLKELRGDEMGKYQVGDKITCDIFQAGDVVDVIGTSKGHGYSGTIKRWNMSIGPKGHGSGYHRGQGSFANQGRYNHGVMPGKHMSGHYGNDSATILNVTVIAVDVEKNAILIKGGIPGAKKSLVTIRSAVKAQKGKPVVKPLLVREQPSDEVAVEEPVVEEVAPVVEEVVSEPVVEETVAEVAVEEAAPEAPAEEPAVEEAPAEEAAPEAPAEEPAANE